MTEQTYLRMEGATGAHTSRIDSNRQNVAQNRLGRKHFAYRALRWFFSANRLTAVILFFGMGQVCFAQIITTVAGGMPCANTDPLVNWIDSPAGVTVDANGNIYVLAGNVVCKLSSSGSISRFAGTGAAGYSGDGGPATSAELNVSAISTIAQDSMGNIYIADTHNNRIRKVTRNGTISTVAGSGAEGYSGDGGPATSAAINFPSAVAVDAAGNLYISDQLNYRVRKVAADGTISTVAGTGGPGYTGDGGPATSATLSWPEGLAVDAVGNLYIADSGWISVVRKVATDGTISTVAGNASNTFGGDGGLATSASLYSPVGIAVDATGNLYIADSGNRRIRKVATNGVISTVAGNGTTGHGGDGGPATSAPVGNPTGVAIDAVGNLYFTDNFNNFLRKITTGGTISTLAGDGESALNAAITPFGVAVDAMGNLYIADSHYQRILKVAKNGLSSTIAGNGTLGYSGDGGPALSAQLGDPSGMAFDARGNLFIADSGNGRVRKVALDGTISTVAGGGIPCAGSGDGGPATSAAFCYPAAVALDSLGNLYVADSSDNVVRKVATNGIISRFAGTYGYGYFSGDGGPATSAVLHSPQGLAVDVAGNLYIADSNNNRIRMIATNGVISTVAGNGTAGYGGDGGPATNAELNDPSGVAVDAVGNLYIADSGNLRIRKVVPNGNISTVAGNGTVGYSGDYGPATNAQLKNPISVTVDQAENFYIADVLNNGVPDAVRKVSNSGYMPLNPARLIDTRSGFSTIDGLFQGQGAVPNLGQVDLSVLGRGGVAASGVDAVVLNVTVTNPTHAGHATVWPAGSARPNASNLNYLAGNTLANLVVVKLGTNNQVSLFSQSSTDLVADVVGYFVAGSDLTSFAPTRLLDTRTGYTTADGQYAGVGALGPGGVLSLPIAGRGSVPASGAGSVVLNLTATAPTAAGYITVWPGNVPLPTASTLNFVAGKTIPNLVISKLSSTGTVSLFNSAGNTDLIADVTAWFPANADMNLLNPARLLDTRVGAGYTTIDGQSQGTGPLVGGAAFDLTVAGRGNVPAAGANAVVLNITVTNPATVGFLQAWPSGNTRPTASNLNYVRGQTIANLVIAKVGANGKISLFSWANTDAVVDVVGWLR